MTVNVIIWLTGASGSGKTSLALLLKEKIPNSIILDGNDMRNSISTQNSFSRKDREEHNLRVARLAKILHEQGFNIIISVISPFQSIRDKVDQIIKPIWICLPRRIKKNYDNPYEKPKNAIFIKSTLSLKQSIDFILNEIKC